MDEIEILNKFTEEFEGVAEENYIDILHRIPYIEEIKKINFYEAHKENIDINNKIKDTDIHKKEIVIEDLVKDFYKCEWDFDDHLFDISRVMSCIYWYAQSLEKGVLNHENSDVKKIFEYIMAYRFYTWDYGPTLDKEYSKIRKY
jgi:hypothetical protein